MLAQTDEDTKMDAFHFFLMMGKVNMSKIAELVGVDEVQLKTWRDAENWRAKRARFRSVERRQRVYRDLKERSQVALRSCDIVLRFLTTDLDRYAREVNPDQEAMFRLMTMIRAINKMALQEMSFLNALEKTILAG